MPRVLAVDYGTKRCGIAETDDLMMIATPLTTVPAQECFAFVEAYLGQFDVVALVVGEPLGLRGQITDGSTPAENFVRRIRKKFPSLLVERENEMYTSKIALQSMVQGGMKKMDRRNKSVVDKVAAALILQSYLLRRAQLSGNG